MSYQSGDKCPACKDAWLVNRSLNDIDEENCRRFIKCPKCNWGISVIVPASSIRRRRDTLNSGSYNSKQR